MPTNNPTANLIYNVNNSATQVLAAKQIKENLFVSLLHRDGKGVTEHTETNASTIRIFKPGVPTGAARQLGATTNGSWFNSDAADNQNIFEYDLNLLYIYDKMTDIPEVQEDMVPVSVFDAANKNIGGRVATEINASTIAEQLANRFNAANAADAWTNIAIVQGTTGKVAYDAVMSASAKLDDGDGALGIQGYPFEERQLLMRSAFRQKLMGETGIILGCSNYAQSMVAKGALSPDAAKEYGNMYCGEIDLIPCYITPAPIWNRAAVWMGNADISKVEAIMCAASATDRGISTMDYVKVIDSPNGAGKRLQPKVRWGINVCYGSGIVPIVVNGTAVPTADVTVAAPGSVA
jgi:hypothetical protein